MPPSAMHGTPVPSSASATFWIAVICGTPTPATMRVVQIEPGPDADLDAVGAVIDQRLARRRAVAMLPPITCDLREVLLDPLHAVEHALRMAVRGIDDEHVDAGLDQRRDALLGALADADRGADAQPAQLRPCTRSGCSVDFEDVLHGDQAAQLEVAVDHQHALEAVLVHQRLGLLEASRPRCTVTSCSRGVMMFLHRLVEVGLEAQVAVGDDADHAARLRRTGKPEIRCCA